MRRDLLGVLVGEEEDEVGKAIGELSLRARTVRHPHAVEETLVKFHKLDWRECAGAREEGA